MRAIALIFLRRMTLAPIGIERDRRSAILHMARLSLVRGLFKSFSSSSNSGSARQRERNLRLLGGTNE